MRKMLITLALVAAPVLAAAQSAQQPDTSKPKAAAQTPDTSKAKPKAKAKAAAKPKAKAEAKPTAKPTAETTDTTKKPN